MMMMDYEMPQRIDGRRCRAQAAPRQISSGLPWQACNVTLKSCLYRMARIAGLHSSGQVPHGGSGLRKITDPLQGPCSGWQLARA